MPMGVVNDEEFEKEIKNSSIPIVGEVVPMPRPGRKDGDVNVPDSLRQIIGETSNIEGRKEALKLAASFGISPSSVSAYANGATSTASYDKPSATIHNHIQERKSKAAGKALSKLTKAMSALTEEKIEASNAKEISSIAKDMAQVVKLMEPEEKIDPNAIANKPQFVVYAPTFIKEEKFETIVAKDNF